VKISPIVIAKRLRPISQLTSRGRLYESRHEDPTQMKEDGGHDDVGGPEMDPPDDVAGGGDIHDVDDALASRLGRWVIELRKPHAGRGKDQEAEERDRAEDVADAVGVRGDRVRQARQTETFVDRFPRVAPASPRG
jgi:hypothetical protein